MNAPKLTWCGLKPPRYRLDDETRRWFPTHVKVLDAHLAREWHVFELEYFTYRCGFGKRTCSNGDPTQRNITRDQYKGRNGWEMCHECAGDWCDCVPRCFAAWQYPCMMMSQHSC